MDRNGLGRWALAGVAAGAAILSGLAGLTSPLDRFILDVAFGILPARPAGRPVVLVAVDERSLKKQGRWPWPRERFARLLDRLAAGEPAAVAFDILFTEPDADADGDQRFAASLTRSGRVVLAMAGAFPDEGTRTVEVLPMVELIGAAAALGHTHIEPDADGRVRRLRLRAGPGSSRQPALAVAALAVAQGDGHATRSDRSILGQGAWADGEVLLPWPALWPQIHRLSFDEALSAKAADFPRGAVVVVGVTAAGLAPAFLVADGLRPRAVPGAELLTAAIAALASGTTVTPLPLMPSLMLAAALAAGFAQASGCRRRRALIASVLALFAVLSVCGLLLAAARIWWAPGAALVGILLSLATAVADGWMREHSAVRALRMRCELALQSIGDAVITVTADGRIASANAATDGVLGVDGAKLVGSRLEEVFRSLDPLALAPTAAGDQPEPKSFDLVVPSAGNPPRELRATLAPLQDRPGGATGLVATFRDVTVERQSIRDMAHRAAHDTLTDLPNRALLDDRIERGLGRARRAGNMVALAFLDLDRFKGVNDSFGHAGGDEVLREVSRRLQAALRESDTVGRIGGDEFVVVLEGLDDPIAALGPLERLAATIARPVEVGGQKLRLSLSIGVAVFPRDAQDRADLLRHADMALYRAKQMGRDRILFFAEDMTARHGTAFGSSGSSRPPSRATLSTCTSSRATRSRSAGSAGSSVWRGGRMRSVAPYPPPASSPLPRRPDRSASSDARSWRKPRPP